MIQSDCQRICRLTAANPREEAALLDGRGGEGRGVRVGPEGLPQGEQMREDLQGRAKSGPQVVRILQASWGRGGNQQNSPNLGPTY